MARFVKGDVVVVLFPFSDLSNAKKRPALVVAELTGEDLILCQITSQALQDDYSIPLRMADFSEGNLHQDSNVRPNRLFTADRRIIKYRVGKTSQEKMGEITAKIVKIFTE